MTALTLPLTRAFGPEGAILAAGLGVVAWWGCALLVATRNHPIRAGRALVRPAVAAAVGYAAYWLLRPYGGWVAVPVSLAV